MIKDGRRMPAVLPQSMVKWILLHSKWQKLFQKTSLSLQRKERDDKKVFSQPYAGLRPGGVGGGGGGGGISSSPPPGNSRTSCSVTRRPVGRQWDDLNNFFSSCDWPMTNTMTPILCIYINLIQSFWQKKTLLTSDDIRWPYEGTVTKHVTLIMKYHLTTLQGSLGWHLLPR